MNTQTVKHNRKIVVDKVFVTRYRGRSLMDWMQKKSLKEFNHLLKFFNRNPSSLVDCGIFHENTRGVKYFYKNANGLIVEDFVSYQEMEGLSSRKYLEGVELD